MFIRLQPTSGIPITRQIADQVRAQIASGALKPGDRLPSVRELARDLTVNQNTILRVYERLTFERLLDRRHGDGTYVADRVPTGQMEVQQRDALRQDVRRVAERARTLGIPPKDLRALLDEAIREESPANKEARS